MHHVDNMWLHRTERKGIICCRLEFVTTAAARQVFAYLHDHNNRKEVRRPASHGDTQPAHASRWPVCVRPTRCRRRGHAAPCLQWDVLVRRAARAAGAGGGGGGGGGGARTVVWPASHRCYPDGDWFSAAHSSRAAKCV